MQITHEKANVEVDSKVITAIGTYYATAQLKKHMKDHNGIDTDFTVKIPGTGRRKLSEGQKWANKLAKLSPEAQAEVKATLNS